MWRYVCQKGHTSRSSKRKFGGRGQWAYWPALCHTRNSLRLCRSARGVLAMCDFCNTFRGRHTHWRVSSHIHLIIFQKYCCVNYSRWCRYIRGQPYNIWYNIYSGGTAREREHIEPATLRDNYNDHITIAVSLVRRVSADQWSSKDFFRLKQFFSSVGLVRTSTV